MKSDNLYKYYKDLPQWAKGVVVVGGLGVTYLLGSSIYNRYFRPKSQDVLNAENDIDRLSNTLKASYGDATYDEYANTIYNAQRTSLGNDSGAILDVALLMKNDLDIAKLIKAYGTRQDYAFGFPTEKYGLFGAMRKGIEADLFGAFSYRIGKINNYWASQGITYQI
jgi:hypothetical protein